MHCEIHILNINDLVVILIFVLIIFFLFLIVIIIIVVIVILRFCLLGSRPARATLLTSIALP